MSDLFIRHGAVAANREDVPTLRRVVGAAGYAIEIETSVDPKWDGGWRDAVEVSFHRAVESELSRERETAYVKSLLEDARFLGEVEYVGSAFCRRNDILREAQYPYSSLNRFSPVFEKAAERRVPPGEIAAALTAAMDETGRAGEPVRPQRVRDAMIRERAIEILLGPDADPRTVSSLAESLRRSIVETRGVSVAGTVERSHRQVTARGIPGAGTVERSR